MNKPLVLIGFFVWISGVIFGFMYPERTNMMWAGWVVWNLGMFWRK